MPVVLVELDGLDLEVVLPGFLVFVKLVEGLHEEVAIPSDQAKIPSFFCTKDNLVFPVMAL